VTVPTIDPYNTWAASAGGAISVTATARLTAQLARADFRQIIRPLLILLRCCGVVASTDASAAATNVFAYKGPPGAEGIR
jgi:predicted CDP-diglyceride synthetase/phosphatidate cytidylyltransferase